MNLELVLAGLCWGSLLGIGYIYAGYPLLVWCCALFRGTAVRKEPVPCRVSIVIVACNEAERLPHKLANLLSMTHADWIVEILVGSDGSTDDTVRVIEAYPDQRVRVHAFDQRRGKPSVLNDLIPLCQGDIVLLADCRQDYDPAVLASLSSNFADPTVGAVSGELMFREQAVATTAARGIGLYWTYEKWIRKSESRFRSVPGATGACYALRKSHFRPIPATTLLDDVAIPMQIVQQGLRCVFEPAALAYDDPSADPRQEAIRKRRTIAGVAQLVRNAPGLMLPWRNPIWWEFVSHKVLRLVSPVLLLLALVSNLLLWDRLPYQVLLGCQAGMYGAALLGWICQGLGLKSRLLGPPLMFVALNLTTALALYDALRGRYRVTWQRSQDWQPPANRPDNPPVATISTGSASSLGGTPSC